MNSFRRVCASAAHWKAFILFAPGGFPPDYPTLFLLLHPFQQGLRRRSASHQRLGLHSVSTFVREHNLCRRCFVSSASGDSSCLRTGEETLFPRLSSLSSFDGRPTPASPHLAAASITAAVAAALWLRRSEGEKSHGVGRSFFP